MSDTIDNEKTEDQTPEAQAEPVAAAPASEPEKAAEAAPAAPERPAGDRPAGDRPAGDRPPRTDSRERSDRPPRRGRFGDDREGGGPSEGGMRMPRFKKKVCIFRQDKNVVVDYKRPDMLERFITDRGKILPRRVTGTCAKHQRLVARGIKRARTIALLPFVEQ
jgi:small subunit ribosomal protein S18